jgi:hypothetical protein
MKKLTVRQWKNRYKKLMQSAEATKDTSTDYRVYDYIHLQLDANTNGLERIRECVTQGIQSPRLTSHEKELLQQFLNDTSEE